MPEHPCPLHLLCCAAQAAAGAQVELERQRRCRELGGRVPRECSAKHDYTRQRRYEYCAQQTLSPLALHG
jgi:hypothetical protein